MKLSRDLIARTALDTLNDSGLDGLTMRLLARELGVQAAALYWHFKNKQELLDAMATLVFREVAGALAGCATESWEERLSGWARALRAAMLRYRDGARVFAGSYIAEPTVRETTEATLAVLREAGFSAIDAVRGAGTLLHYTIGFTIEEQARTGVAYGENNPYRRGEVVAAPEAERLPVTFEVLDELLGASTDEGFEHGLRLLLAGMRADLAGAGHP